jgi:hypothetical protein
MKKILFAALLFFALQSSAQNTVISDSSSVIVHKDARIDLLMSKQAQINEITSRDARKLAKGFRCENKSIYLFS